MGECIFLFFICFCLSVLEFIDNNDFGCCGRNDIGLCMLVNVFKLCYVLIMINS